MGYLLSQLKSLKNLISLENILMNESLPGKVCWTEYLKAFRVCRPSTKPERRWRPRMSMLTKWLSLGKSRFHGVHWFDVCIELYEIELFRWVNGRDWERKVGIENSKTRWLFFLYFFIWISSRGKGLREVRREAGRSWEWEVELESMKPED